MNVVSNPQETNEARRRFLAKCGKFAVITPPVVTLMLTATHGNYAAAHSGFHGGGGHGHGHGHGHHHGRGRGDGHGRGGRHANNGFGNGGDDGVPGKSGKQDKTR